MRETFYNTKLTKMVKQECRMIFCQILLFFNLIFIPVKYKHVPRHLFLLKKLNVNSLEGFVFLRLCLVADRRNKKKKSR